VHLKDINYVFITLCVPKEWYYIIIVIIIKNVKFTVPRKLKLRGCIHRLCRKSVNSHGEE